MNKILSLRNFILLTLTILWSTVAIRYQFLDQLYQSTPANILKIADQSPNLTLLSFIALINSMGLLTITTIAIIINNRYSKYLFALFLGITLFMPLLLSPTGIFLHMANIDDVIYISLGMLTGLLIKQTTHYNLGSLTSRRRLCNYLLLAMLLFFYCVSMQNLYLPQPILDYSLAQANKNVGTFGGICFIIYLLSIISLYFSAKYTKYIYALSLLFSVFSGPIYFDPASAFTNFFEKITLVVNGLLLISCFTQSNTNAVEPSFSLSILDVQKNAIKRLKGSKLVLWQAVAIIIVVSLIKFGITKVNAAVFPNAIALGAFIGLVFALIRFLLLVGFEYISAVRASDQPIDIELLFKPFTSNYFFKLVGLGLLAGIILLPGMALLFYASHLIESISTITDPTMLAHVKVAVFNTFIIAYLYLFYFGIRLFASHYFVLIYNLSPTAAIAASFRCTRQVVFKLFLLHLIRSIMLLLGIVTLGIGLIWAVPMYGLYSGVAFTKLAERK